MSKKHYAPRLAKSVRGGLRPQGANRDVWWRKQWISWLEELRLGARLGRGRNYAQQGQIKSMTVDVGNIAAVIQGASTDPYTVSVSMDPIAPETAEAIFEEHPLLAAQILTHSLPHSFEDFLKARGATLFPLGRSNIRFSCTCKDWTRPCKHIAAALCLFADATAVDPLLLLRFRGLLFEEPPPRLEPRTLKPEAITALHPVGDPTAVPRRLGALPYWRGEEDFRKSLESAYRRAHTKAVMALDSGIADMRFPEDIPAE